MSKLLNLKIDVAETGSNVNVLVEIGNNDHVGCLNKLKNQIAIFVSIPVDEQIILIGPPYKRLDATVFISFDLHQNDRIFVFDRRILSDAQREPLRAILQPTEIPTPLPVGDPSDEISILLRSNSISSNGNSSTSPLLQAVAVYERQFLTNLRKGEAYQIAAEMSLSSCRKCYDDMIVQVEAITAAWDNLNDHYKSTKNSFESSQDKLLSQQSRHEGLLRSFEQDLEQLRCIQLHPCFASIIKQQLINKSSSIINGINSSVSYVNSSSNGNGSDNTTAVSVSATVATNDSILSFNINDIIGGIKVSIESDTPLTLLDCLSIEKEKAWYRQCKDVHMRVESNLSQLQQVFNQVSVGIGKIMLPVIDTVMCADKLAEISSHAIRIQNDMTKIRNDYVYVYETITMACNNGSNTSIDADLVPLLTTLENKRRQQDTELLQPMMTSCNLLMQIKNETFAYVKHVLSLSMYSSLRAIAGIQTDIQYKLKKGLEIMKKWHKGHNQYFSHLEHVANLPDAYHQLLLEVVRRKAFNTLFERRVTSISNELAAFRGEETACRERFLQSQGTYLPPLFFHMIPSLKDKPPYFSPSLTSSQWLPEITIDDITADRGSGGTDTLGGRCISDRCDSRSSSCNDDDSDCNANQVIFDATDAGTACAATTHDNNYYSQRCAKLEYDNALLLSQLAELTKQVKASHVSTPVAVVADASITTTGGTATGSTATGSNTTDGTTTGGTTTGGTDSTAQQHQTKDTASVGTSTTTINRVDAHVQVSQPATPVEKSHERIEELIAAIMTGYSTITDIITNNDSNGANSSSSDDILIPSSSYLCSDSISDCIRSSITHVRNLYVSAAQAEVKRTHIQQHGSDISCSPNSDVHASSKTIAFLDFMVGDIALFWPAKIDPEPVYVAFHVRQPHHYLSKESLQQFTTTNSPIPTFVIGRIIYIDTHTASSSSNPFFLTHGTEYHILHVEDVTSSLSCKSDK